jgi:acetyl esterase/lipase
MLHRSAAMCILVAGLCVVANRAACSDSFDVTRDVVYVKRGDEALLADVYMPRGAGPFPAVVAVHGGGWSMGSKSRMTAYCQMLADAGFTVVTIDYRLAPKHPFPAQIEDCKSAVRWMRNHAQQYKIDGQRIGALGYSAGGHLVALLGATDESCGLEGADADGTSTRLQCVVAGGAPCDFRDLPAQDRQLAFWLGGTRADKPQTYELASPAHFVTRDDPPMLFFHGGADSLVPIASAQGMVEKLSAAGVTTRLYNVEDTGHVRAFFDDGAHRESIKFLSEHLQATPK